MEFRGGLDLPRRREFIMKFISGIVLGVLLSTGVWTMSAQDRREREFHPQIARAVEALRDARAYMMTARHDFGGHRVEAVRATDEAIRQLNFALAYREREERR
jgi:hypothetical protein